MCECLIVCVCVRVCGAVCLLSRLGDRCNYILNRNTSSKEQEPNDAMATGLADLPAGPRRRTSQFSRGFSPLIFCSKDEECERKPMMRIPMMTSRTSIMSYPFAVAAASILRC